MVSMAIPVFRWEKMAYKQQVRPWEVWSVGVLRELGGAAERVWRACRMIREGLEGGSREGFFREIWC